MKKTAPKTVTASDIIKALLRVDAIKDERGRHVAMQAVIAELAGRDPLEAAAQRLSMTT